MVACRGFVLLLRPERGAFARFAHQNPTIMSLKKQFLKSRPACKVTFTLESDLVDGAKEVALLGDFNNWNPADFQMRKLKDGAFTKTVELESEKEYQFRYLIDGTRWVNDSGADAYVHSGVANEQNGVVKV